MCGIHGVYRLDGGVADASVLSAMGRVTRHRGPDDEGTVASGPCAIGMRRLSIIDVSGGHQPIANADGTAWVVCNGEIYNFRELRAELEASGYRFRTRSDSEVVLHLYDAMGDAFVERLDGMFDFAIWDARRGRLVLGRDALGVKPLYLYRDASLLAFATEAKALLALPQVRAELDRDALAELLHLGYVPAPRSAFAGIRKLPPATLLTVEGGRVTERRYWRLPSRVERGVDDAEWAARIRSGLDGAVRSQMVSDVPIGAFLSGGVDSSAVVALMARHSEQRIRTYSIGFDGGPAERLYNELPYARQVADLFGTDHHEIVVRPDIVTLLPKLVWHLDEPLCDSAFVTTFLVSEFARRDVKVILSGVGGDELFGGYRRYLGHRLARRFDAVPAGLRRALAALASRLPADRHSRLGNRLRLARGFAASLGQAPDDRYRGYLQVLPREAAASLLLEPPPSGPDALERAFEAAGDDDDLNRMFGVDVETQLPDDLLMLTDKMSMAASLECRVPLLDRALAELAARIPSEQKVRGGRLKHLMKDALADLLPASILDREKRGFGTPMGAWMKRELAPVLRSLLSEPVVRARGLFSPDGVARLVRDHEAARIDGTDPLVALLTLEIWMRIFVDGREAADVADELAETLR